MKNTCYNAEGIQNPEKQPALVAANNQMGNPDLIVTTPKLLANLKSAS